MVDPRSFAKCEHCGTEYVSAFYAAQLALGNQETCPNCRKLTRSPDYIDGERIIAEAKGNESILLSRKLLVKFFPQQSYNLNLKNTLICEYHEVYKRNVLDISLLLESYYSASTENKQSLVRTAINMIASAYEVMVYSLMCQVLGPEGGGASHFIRRDRFLRAISESSNSALEEALRGMSLARAFRNCFLHRSSITDIKLNNDLNKIRGLEGRFTIPLGVPLSPPVEQAFLFVQQLEICAKVLFVSTDRHLGME